MSPRKPLPARVTVTGSPGEQAEEGCCGTGSMRSCARALPRMERGKWTAIWSTVEVGVGRRCKARGVELDGLFPDHARRG